MTSPPKIVVARGWGGARVRKGLLIIGISWIVALGGAGLSKKVSAALPTPIGFLLSSSCLFPWAAQAQIEYRVEGFACDAGRAGQFVELDHRPYFPIHADNKESVFARIGHFYRNKREVMEALERYLVEEHGRRAAATGDAGDGIEGPIGGIRFLSLRIPLPPLGAHIEPYEVRPARSYPSTIRRPWYMTQEPAYTAACAAAEREQ